MYEEVIKKELEDKTVEKVSGGTAAKENVTATGGWYYTYGPYRGGVTGDNYYIKANQLLTVFGVFKGYSSVSCIQFHYRYGAEHWISQNG